MFLDELDEDPVGGSRMDERDLPAVGSGPRLRVDELECFRLEAGHLLADVLRLESEVVQRVVRGFNRFRVVHPYCRQCIGDKSVLNTLAKQLGSIVYFKWMKKLK